MDDLSSQSRLQRTFRKARGISFQLIALLSVALLPVGAISVSQSLVFAEESRKAAETLLLSLTAEGASVEARLILSGFKAADGLAAGIIASHGSAFECDKLLADFIAGQILFGFANFATVDGKVECTSAPSGDWFSGSDGFVRMPQSAKRFVYRVRPKPNVNDWALVTAIPVEENGKLLGFLSIAAPSLQLQPLVSTTGLPRPTNVIVVNTAGNLLTSVADLDLARDHSVSAAMLERMLVGPDRVIDGADFEGVQSTFVKVTLLPGVAYAIGTWPMENAITQTQNVVFDALLFPILMWLAGLLVAIMAAERLVIRPVHTLRGAMRRFALGERNVAVTLPASAPIELLEVVQTFNGLERIIERNERALAEIAEEKLLLLREVHHRIKNNLQMISSIISIQGRKTTDASVKLVLRRLQDRVLSIAAVDQSLYQNGDVWDVRADDLIRSITDRLIGVNLELGHRVEVATDYDEVLLNADQIGPLSLLANEAVTNALKYVGIPAAGRAFVQITLKRVDGLVRFVVVNSIAPGTANRKVVPEGSYLGMPLINAFADQLGAACKSGANEADQTFRLTVEFRPKVTVPGPPGETTA